MFRVMVCPSAVRANHLPAAPPTGCQPTSTGLEGPSSSGSVSGTTLGVAPSPAACFKANSPLSKFSCLCKVVSRKFCDVAKSVGKRGWDEDGQKARYLVSPPFPLFTIVWPVHDRLARLRRLSPLWAIKTRPFVPVVVK